MIKWGHFGVTNNIISSIYLLSKTDNCCRNRNSFIIKCRIKRIKLTIKNKIVTIKVVILNAVFDRVYFLSFIFCL